MALLKSKILSAKKFIQVFKESTENNQRFCFILGSGASVESGIPSGGILEMDWMDCLMGIRSDRGTAPMDPEESERIALHLLEEKAVTHDFKDIKSNWEEAKAKGWKSMSSEFYFDLFKLRFHPEQQNGYRYLESLMAKIEPSPGYRALALLLTRDHLHNLVITTNFDNLVEDALFLHTEWRPLVISHEALAEYIQFNTRRPIIVKVHRGLMYNPFNSPETTNELKAEWKDALDYAFKTYTPVVVGYGGGDGSLMTYLKETNFPNGIYWCYREASGEPDDDIIKFLEEKGGCLVKTDGFDALMYSIGGSLYGDEVGIKKTRAHLESQCELRTKNYIDKWNDLGKQDAAKEAAKVVKAAELEAEIKRAEEDELTYWDHFDRAYAAAENDDHDTAIREYTLAIKKDSSRPIAYNNRGSSYHNQRDYKRAIQDYDRAIELKPDYVDAYYNRGLSYNDQKDYKRAIQDYDKALELDPSDVPAYFNRGNSYNSLNRYKSAIQDFSKAIMLDPKDSSAYHNRGVSYKNLNQYDQAILDYNKAIELDPNSVDSYIARGICYDEQKQHDKAILDYNRSIELDPNYAVAYNCRAFTYAEQGEYEKAFSNVKTALNLEPDEPNALHTYGFIYLQQENYPQAIEYFTKVLSFDDKLKDAYEDRAKAYRAIGETTLAEADEAKAAELEAEEKKNNS